MLQIVMSVLWTMGFASNSAPTSQAATRAAVSLDIESTTTE
jgi:hypothetical protein